MEIQRRRKIPVVKGYPPFLKVEPTNLCNLKCPNCFSGSGADKRGKGLLDFDMYKKVIDEIGDFLIKINLYFWGEPFLHPRLFDMVSYAANRNIGTCVSTNFLLFSEEKAEELLISGLDHLIICFDGVDQQTYEAYRKGGSFDKFLKNMEILSKVRRERNLYSTIVDVQFLVFDYNIDQIEDAKRLIKPFEFDRFTLKMDAEQKEPYNPDTFRSNVPCYWLWLVPTISWDGTLTPCCDMPPTNFGNLYKQTFMEIWNGEKYVEARNLYKHADPQRSKSMCTFCHRGPNEKYKQELAQKAFQGPRLFFCDDERPWEE
jgi:MoaA/NifB/PqqE/SkfB family radical SAM enzyme